MARYKSIVPSGWFLGLLTTLLVALACENGVFTLGQRVPVVARFREKGSACEVEVYYSNSVRGRVASEPAYYRLPTGEMAVSTENIIDTHGVIVRFDSPVDTDDPLVIGAGYDGQTSMRISQNNLDAEPAVLLSAVYLGNAVQPTVMLAFDDALDPATASDVTHYSVAGTIEHPVTALPVNCGQEVELQFDTLPANLRLDIEGLTDVNGLTVEEHLGWPVDPASEEQRPTIESAAFASDSETLAIDVVFHEAVDRVTAALTTNYVLMPDAITPSQTEVLTGGRTVRLHFAELDPPVTLDVANVLDLSGNPMLPVEQYEVAVDETDTTAPSAAGAFLARRFDGLVIELAMSEAVRASTAEQLYAYRLIGDGDDVEDYETAGQPPKTVTMQSGAAAVELTFPYVPEDAQVVVLEAVDFNGNALESPSIVAVDYSLSDAAPEILDVAFVADASTTQIDILFDIPVAQVAAENEENYILPDDTVATAAQLLDDGRTVRITVGPLTRTEAIEIGGVSDLAGNVMTRLTSTIASATDTTAPSVTTATFASDSEVPAIYVQFGEAVDRYSAETLTNFTATVGNLSPTTATLLDDGVTVELVFTTLATDTELSVRNVSDLSGNVMTATQTTVQRDVDTTAPEVVDAVFVANQTVPTVDIQFNEAMNETMAESAGLYLLGTDYTAASTATLRNDGRTVRLTFPPISISDQLLVRSVPDIAGNPMVIIEEYEVTAASDTDEPVIVSAAFAANATSPTINLTFNEAVDESSAETITNYALKSSARHPTSATLQSDSLTVALVFAGLSDEDSLEVSDVRDFGGNFVDDALEIHIANATDTTAPTLSSVTVNSTTQITVVYSEAVDSTSATAIGNYRGLPSGVTVLSTALQSDGRTVILTLLGTDVSSGDQIDVQGVKDLNGNTMTAVADYTMS